MLLTTRRQPAGLNEEASMSARPKHLSTLAVIGAAAAASAAIALPGSTVAQTSDGTRTITVQEKVVDIAKDDVAPKSKRKVSLGDRLITRQSLFDANKKRVGTLFTDCSGVGATKPIFDATLQCSLTYRFADGQIIAAGTTSLTGGKPISLIGGTGAYAGVRGTVQLTKPAAGFDSADLITING